MTEPFTQDSPPAPQAARPTRPWLTIVLAIVAAVALLAAGLAFNAYRNEKSKVDDLEAQVDGLHERIAQLEAEAEAAEDDDGLVGGIEDLLGGEGLGGLEDLLGDEGLGGLEDLLGGDALGGLGGATECVAEDVGGLLGGGGADIPDDDPDAEYAAVAEWVENERGLQFESVPEPTYVSADEMATRVEEQIRADYPADDVRADQELYTALGAIPAGTDLLDEYSEFVGGQVAGYYDPDTGELVVLGDGTEPFDSIELTTIAHELEHALAHQALDFPIEDELRAADPDKQLAGLGLIEGDATLTMTRFQLGATNPLDLLGSLGSGELQEQAEALENAPEYFARQLMFPYTEGLSFVCALESEGGWTAVDGAYANPPTTTAQVLFPERYSAGEAAVDASDPQSPGAGWEEVRRMTFGAADLMFLIDRDAAEQWAGGEIAQFRNGDAVAVRISLAAEDDETLCATITDWAETLENATATCNGTEVAVSIG